MGPQKVADGYKKPSKIQTTTEMAQNDPKNIPFMLNDVPRHFFFQNFCLGLPNYCYRPKMVLQKVTVGYTKPS